MDKEKARSYHSFRRLIYYYLLVVDFVFLTGIQFAGVSELWRDFALSVSQAVWLGIALYFFIFSLAVYLLHFPLNCLRGHILEHNFDLSVQNFGAWLKDDLKKAAFGFGIALIMVEGIYAILRAMPELWWVPAGCFWLFVTLVLARIMPQVVVPLFFKTIKLEAGELRESIEKLFQRCGIPLKDVLKVEFSDKTTKANAFVCGLGSSRRVFLSDTLIENFETAEVETVVAHELGHIVHHDIIRMMVIQTMVTFASFWLISLGLENAQRYFGIQQISDIAFLPMILLCLGGIGLVTTPLTNALSRWMEVRADQYSLEHTEDSDCFVSMMEKLGEMNLAEDSPSRFDEIMFYDHPPISRRIAFAKTFKPV